MKTIHAICMACWKYFTLWLCKSFNIYRLKLSSTWFVRCFYLWKFCIPCANKLNCPLIYSWSVLMCFRAINPALCALLSLPPFANLTTHCRSFCGDWKHPGISPILSNLCPGVSCWLAIRFTRKAKVRWVFFWGFSSLLRLGYRWYSEPRF